MDLHVLNGDAIQPTFAKAFPESKQMVFREILCEGPCTHSLFSPEFFRQRREFLKLWGDSESIDSFESLWSDFRLKADSHLYLWFEKDLFCFLNLIAILDFLADHAKSSSIRLIWAGHPQNQLEHPNLAYYKPEDFQATVNSALEVSATDLQFASKLWAIWQSDDHSQFQNFKQGWDLIPDYRHLLHLHIQRFPSAVMGLGIEEELLLGSLAEGADNYRGMMRQVLTNQDLLGFGDLQFEMKLKELVEAQVIQKNVDQSLELSSLGKAILDKKKNYNMPGRVWGNCDSRQFHRNHKQMLSPVK